MVLENCCLMATSRLCGDQDPHTDFDLDPPYPDRTYFAITALEEDTLLHYQSLITGTSAFRTCLWELNVACRVGKWEEAVVPLGHIVFVHPLVVHAGYGYNGKYLQLRAHGYGVFPAQLFKSESDMGSVNVQNVVYLPETKKQSLDAARLFHFSALSHFSVVCTHLTWPSLEEIISQVHAGAAASRHGGYGQLGRGGVDNEMVPRLVEGLLAEMQVVVGVAAGYEHTVVRTAKGQVLAFGNVSFGKLGHGPGGGSNLVMVPRLVQRLLYGIRMPYV